MNKTDYAIKQIAKKASKQFHEGLVIFLKKKVEDKTTQSPSELIKEYFELCLKGEG